MKKPIDKKEELTNVLSGLLYTLVIANIITEFTSDFLDGLDYDDFQKMVKEKMEQIEEEK